MKKLKIPRKMRKIRYMEKHIKSKRGNNHKSTPKLDRYYKYFYIQKLIKKYGMTPEQLCQSIYFVSIDDIIWWNWVRWKHFGITPQKDSEILNDYAKYFKETMEDNNIII